MYCHNHPQVIPSGMFTDCNVSSVEESKPWDSHTKWLSQHALTWCARSNKVLRCFRMLSEPSKTSFSKIHYCSDLFQAIPLSTWKHWPGPSCDSNLWCWEASELPHGVSIWDNHNQLTPGKLPGNYGKSSCSMEKILYKWPLSKAMWND